MRVFQVSAVLLFLCNPVVWAAPTAEPVPAAPPAIAAAAAVTAAALPSGAAVSAQASETTPGVGAYFSDKLQEVGRETSTVAARLVNTAMGLIGVPYRFGGNSVATGLDCSAFVRLVFQETVGLVLPRRAIDQARATQSIPRSELRPGDLVFFNTMRRAFSHVGIYVGDGKFIHSPRAGRSVRVEDMTKAYWVQRFNGATRVVVPAAT